MANREGQATCWWSPHARSMPEEECETPEELDADDPERKKRMEDVRKVCMRRRRAPEEKVEEVRDKP